MCISSSVNFQLIATENEWFSVILWKRTAASKHLCCFILDTKQLLLSPPCLRKKLRRSEAAWKLHDDNRRQTCLHQSASFLATDEDEQRCDDLPVFDKCVFHLIGEKSARGKSRRRNREWTAKEGRCEANSLRGTQKKRVAELGRETARPQPTGGGGGRKRKLQQIWSTARLVHERCVLSEPHRVSMNSVWSV